MGAELSSHAFGRPAFITGGASGIGKAVAARCIHLGMSPVCLLDLDTDALEKTQREFAGLCTSGQSVEIFKLDVSSAEENQHVAEDMFQRFGDCAFLFLNAGITTGGSLGFEALFDTKLEDYHRVINIDMHGVWYGIRSFVPHMIKVGRPGLVLSTASVAGLMNTSLFTNISYQLAKHGVVLMMELLYSGLRKEHPQLHAAVLCPFITETNIARHTYEQDAISAGQQPVEPQQGPVGPSVPVAVCVERLEHELRRGAFYIVTPDRYSDLEHVVARLQLKRDAVMFGNPPMQESLGQEFKASVRDALAVARADRQKVISAGGAPPLPKANL